MTNDLFADAALDTEISHINAEMVDWFQEPVLYQGMIVTRSSAFQLCAEETRSWAQMDMVNDLDKIELRPGSKVLSAAEAYSHIFRQYNQPIASRDI